ncbi:putative transporting ATPase [Escherichia coli]|uniref:Putative transporting ATPase n=1 Tax=Escherichia coli TaxID=562 RepID=A0A376TVF4_ECOLX|nr:putative transporting ATPase [Escherichia coli]
MNSTHHYEQLIEIFNSCFADEFNTRLIKGDDEPIYLPADAEVPYNELSLPTAFMPAQFMRFRTGVLPEKRAVSWLISATGIARMGVMPKRKASLKMLK